MLSNQIKYAIVYKVLMLIRLLQYVSLAVDGEINYTWSLDLTKELSNGLRVFRVDKSLKKIESERRTRSILLVTATITTIYLLILFNYLRLICSNNSQKNSSLVQEDEDND